MVLRVIPTNKENGAPIVESRFYGIATSVEAYAKQLRENGYSYKAEDGKTYQSGTYSAVHQADFVGNKWLLGLVGNNDTTGGDCWFCYSHSSYFAEVPNSKTELEDFVKKWGVPKDKYDNLSQPKLVIPTNKEKVDIFDENPY